jgi:predicted class III extradiol MEMO1 family dioxygenase
MICSLKCDDFFESILRQEIEACGFGGILFIMELARELGIRQA